MVKYLPAELSLSFNWAVSVFSLRRVLKNGNLLAVDPSLIFMAISTSEKISFESASDVASTFTIDFTRPSWFIVLEPPKGLHRFAFALLPMGFVARGY